MYKLIVWKIDVLDGEMEEGAPRACQEVRKVVIVPALVPNNEVGHVNV